MVVNVFMNRIEMKIFSKILLELKIKNKLSERHDFRFFVSADFNYAVMQSHYALSPAHVTSQLNCEHDCNTSLDIVISIEAFYSALKALPASEFFRICVDTENYFLYLDTATFNGGLLDGAENKYITINSKAKNRILVQETELITDYVLKNSNLISDFQNFRFRKSHKEKIDKMFALMDSSSQPAKAKVLLTGDENSVYLELQAVDAHALMTLFELTTEFDLNTALTYEQFKFLRSSIDQLIKSKIFAVDLNCSNENLLFLKSGGISINFSNLPNDLFFEPLEHFESEGWLEVTNDFLQEALSLIKVSPRAIDDIVTIQVLYGELTAELSAGRNNASYSSKLKSIDNSVCGPAIVLNRLQLENAIDCFNKYDTLKIHGLLTTSTRLVIKSLLVKDVVTLSITQPLDSP